MVKDDDTVVGELVVPIKIRNVMPAITSNVTAATGPEGSLILPSIEYWDPGTSYPGRNTERWNYWWDMNHNGILDSSDLTGPVTDITEIDNKSYCRTPEVVATINDDYRGTAECWIYDDDTPTDYMYAGTLYLPGYGVTDASFEVYQWANVWESINWSSIGYLNGPITYCYDMSVYQNLKSWNEYTVNWTNYGGISTTNMNFAPEDTLTLAERKAIGIGGPYPSGGSAHWETFEVTNLVYKWLEGLANNNGLSIMPTMVNNKPVSGEHTVYYSSGWPQYVYSGYKPILRFDVDTDNDGVADVSYVFQPSDGKDAWIAQCSLNKSIYRQDGNDTYIFPNLYDTGIGYSSIGSFYRRGLVEFDLSSVSWRKEKSVVWIDPGFNHTIGVSTHNVNPTIECPYKVDILPFEEAQIPIKLHDEGSDDIMMTWTWGDEGGSTRATNYMVHYNNGATPEPVYPPTHSAFNGTSPFEVPVILKHWYPTETADYMLNMTIWDDDGGYAEHTNYTIIVHVVAAKELKEKAIQMLEPLIPGHLALLGYSNITLRYNGKVDPTLLVYNHIARPPCYWEEKLFLTLCDVKPGDKLEISASTLDEGLFGTKLVLKLYNDKHRLIDVSEIPTAPSCIDPLEVNDVYGQYTVLGFTEVEGISYQHYSKYALKTEDAMDHILRSINKDPRRGYGWWHQVWVWWCGYWEFRDLWLDENRLDPQFGPVVFCEERLAAQNLMEVVQNCLRAEGVTEITFEYIGPGKVDIEAYTLEQNMWNGTWKWIHREYDLENGDTFTLTADMCNSTKLGPRTMFRVFNSNTGNLADVVYIRTSGNWPLEVMPGNIYNEYWEIENSTLLLSGDTEWWHWWGDFNWWDLYFNFWSRSGCGWEVEKCEDPDEAAREKARVCSNLTVIWGAIKLLMTADEILAKIAYMDAENLTLVNSSYATEYKYHLKQAKRYSYSAGREAKMGKPYHAINDYKVSWKHAKMAIKYAFKSNADDPLGEFYDACEDEAPCPFQQMCGVDYPWWMDWYKEWCPDWDDQDDDDDDDDDDGDDNGDGDDDDGIKFYRGRGKGFWKTNIGKHLGEISGKAQVPKADIMKYLKAISDTYGGKHPFLKDLTLEDAYEILCIPDASDMQDKAQAHLLALLLNAEHFGQEYKDCDVYLLNMGLGVEYEGTLSGAINYILGLYKGCKYAAVKVLSEALCR
jgi:hypothetical protein